MINVQRIKTSNIKSSNYEAVAFVAAVFSIIAFVLCINSSGIYRYICFLPLFYSVLNIIFKNIYRSPSLATVFVLIFMFIRYSVTPVVLFIESFPADIDSYYLFYSEQIALLSTFVMIAEMIAIFITLEIIRRKKRKTISVYNSKNVISYNNFSKLSWIIIPFVLVVAFLYIKYPILFKNYSFILDKSLNKIGGETDLFNSLPFGVEFVGYTFGEVIRFIIIQNLIFIIYKKLCNNHAFIGFLLSIIIVLINLMFTGSRLVLGILMNCVYAYEIYSLYGRYKKLFRLMIIIFGAILITAAVVFYWGPSMGAHSISLMLQNYTCGYYDVYQSLYAYFNSGITIADKIWMFVWGDGLSNVVVISSFVNPENTSSHIYNYFLYGRQFDGGIIVPLISQSCFYFTPIIAPFISSLFIIIMNKFEKRAHGLNSFFFIDIFLASSFAVAPFMYNVSILIHFLSNIIIPIYIMTLINNIFISKQYFKNGAYISEKA